MQDLVTNMKLTPATSVPNSFLRLPAKVTNIKATTYFFYIPTILISTHSRILATAWECSPGRSLCLTKSSARGRLWQFACWRVR